MQRVREEQERERIERQRRETEMKDRIAGMAGRGGGMDIAALYLSGELPGGPASHAGATEREQMQMQREVTVEHGAGSGPGPKSDAKGIDSGNGHDGVTVVGEGNGVEPPRKKLKVAGAGPSIGGENENLDRFKVTGDVTAWMNGSDEDDGGWR